MQSQQTNTLANTITIVVQITSQLHLCQLSDFLREHKRIRRQVEHILARQICAAQQSENMSTVQ